MGVDDSSHEDDEDGLIAKQKLLLCMYFCL